MNWAERRPQHPLTGLLALLGATLLACNGPAPEATPTGSAATTQTTGLDWSGDGSVRRMLYWHNPFPIYDATYVFKVYPRKKDASTKNSPTGYYTTFFWGNDGIYGWDNGNANTYYGAHPYPVPPTLPNYGPGQWEISVESNDFVTGSEVQWGQWYTQVFRAWRSSDGVAHHEFYWDWPDMSKMISHDVPDPNWAQQAPPRPAIVIGQAPDNGQGQSWGGYPGWEEFNGIIRGIQMYSGLLSSLDDINNEIASPLSTPAGRNKIWYLNLNPTPTDTQDRSGRGHHPSWDGNGRPSLYIGP